MNCFFVLASAFRCRRWKKHTESSYFLHILAMSVVCQKTDGGYFLMKGIAFFWVGGLVCFIWGGGRGEGKRVNGLRSVPYGRNITGE